MEAACGNADLGTEPKLAAVGKLRRGIVQDDGRINLCKKSLGRGGVAGDNGIGMMGAIALDVLNGGRQPIHHLHGDDGVEVLGLLPTLVGWPDAATVDDIKALLHPFVAMSQVMDPPSTVTGTSQAASRLSDSHLAR